MLILFLEKSNQEFCKICLDHSPWKALFLEWLVGHGVKPHIILPLAATASMCLKKMLCIQMLASAGLHI